MGFNLSKTFENHLKQLMTQLSTENSVNNVNSALKNYEEWAEPELNRRPLACKGTHLDVDWVDFKEWLSHKYAKSHVPSTLSYCKRYNHIIWGDLRDVEKISPKSKNSVIKA
jgi:predicted ATPase